MSTPSSTQETRDQSERAWPRPSDGPNASPRAPFRLHSFCRTSIAALALVAWGEHIHTTWNEGAWALLIAGALLVPLGVVHGIGVWIGLW